MPRTCHNVWLHRFSCLLGLTTLCLVALGGVVTTKGVGMAVPDWPTTYGENMFLFPPSKWIGGIFYEHTHRLLASWVGLLTIVLAVWLWRKESRRWLRWLGVAAVVAVVVQGLLGGFRVVFDEHGLGTEFGILHAALAQLFFLLLCSIALFTSQGWCAGRFGQLLPASAVALRRWFGLTTGLILMQLIFGATMRHQHAGLAVPDFPLAHGKLWPATDDASIQFYNAHRLEAAGEQPITAPHIVVHMLHRSLGFILLLAIAGCAMLAKRRAPAGSWVRRGAALWVGLAVVQVTLGVLSILSQRKVDVTTAHVALGALTFALGWLLVLLSSRPLVAAAREAQSHVDSSSPSALSHA